MNANRVRHVWSPLLTAAQPAGSDTWQAFNRSDREGLTPPGCCLDAAMAAFYGLDPRLTRGARDARFDFDGLLGGESPVRGHRHRIRRLRGQRGPRSRVPRGLNCVDDSPRCIAERQATLKQLVSDPQRTLGQGTADSIGLCFGRPPLRLQDRQEGSLLRRACAWPARGRWRCVVAQGRRLQSHSGASFARHDVRERGRPRALQRDEAPLQKGLSSECLLRQARTRSGHLCLPHRT